MKELFGIFLIVIFISAGCSNHDECNTEYKELEQKYTQLEEKYKDLKKDNKSLKKSNFNLECENSSLTKNTEILKKDIENYKKEIENHENVSVGSNTSVNHDSDTSNEQQVYITAGGKRYHTVSDCSGMKSPSLVAISKAISKGKTACNNCYSSSSNESSDSSSADDYEYSDEDYYYDEPEKCPLYDWCPELYNHGHEDEGLIYEPIEPPIDIETES